MIRPFFNTIEIHFWSPYVRRSKGFSCQQFVITIFCHWRLNFWLPLIVEKNISQVLSKNILHAPFKIQLSTIEIFQLPILWRAKKVLIAIQ